MLSARATWAHARRSATGAMITAAAGSVVALAEREARCSPEAATTSLTTALAQGQGSERKRDGEGRGARSALVVGVVAYPPTYLSLGIYVICMIIWPLGENHCLPARRSRARAEPGGRAR